MRPALVLPLVLVAVAALVTALWLLGSSDDTTPRQDVAGPSGGGATAATPQAAGDLRPTGQRATAPAPDAATPTERTPASAEAREAVSDALGAWSNGILVRVVDPAGEPVPNANVELRDDAGAAFGEMVMLMQPENQRVAPRRGRTNDRGEHRFENLAPGRYAVAAHHPDFARGEVAAIGVLETGEVETRVALTAGLTLEGRVGDQGGAPIAGATLTLVPTLYSALAPDHPTYKARAVTATTDAAGAYRFERLEPGSRSLTASAPGYGSRTQQNVLIIERGANAGPLTQEFRLDPGFRITGEVVAPDRSPIADAELQAINYASAQTSMGRARTGADGRFELTDLAPGTYQIIARAQGWKEEREQRVEAGATNVRIELGELGGAVGRVTDATSGQPVAAFELRVRRANTANGTLGRVERREQFKSPTGEYHLAGLDEGEYVLEAEANGFARTPSARFRVEEGIVTAQVDIALSRGGTILGRVLDVRTGEPLSGARVTTQESTFVRNPFTEMLQPFQARNTTERTVRTDAQGNFRLDLLTPETYQLEIEHSGLVTQVIRDVKVTDGAETPIPEVRLSPGAVVRGLVTDQAGQPMVGAKVTIVSALAGPSYEEVTDANGRYAIRQVAPGAYRASARRPIGQDFGGPNDPFSAILDTEKTKREVYVVEGGELNLDFQIGSS